ncbi:hypothetical protein LWI29_011239 [Acer saccharum]|uniref:Protein kinase domain-containing protein n=1 Tax=Acer saccharum TaxID=4024 RepID=A0AA39SIG3_ACESA|nr:hypothetical protein LWI29_011239 [Acer saccharum]
MSPELVKDKLMTFTADIWALGCVVVEMMSGKPVWGYGLGRDELLNRIGYRLTVHKCLKLQIMFRMMVRIS